MILDRFRQRFVDVVEGQIALLLGLADQLANLLVDASGRDIFRPFGPIGAGRAVEDRFDGFGLFGGGLLRLTRHCDFEK